MKPLITTLAICILCIAILFSVIDLNKIEQYSYKVKYTSDRMANAATLLLDSEYYRQSQIVFDYPQCIDLAVQVLGGNLGYVGYVPVNSSYFTDTAQVDMYFFDDSLQARHYINGALIETFSFRYGNSIQLYVPSYKEDIQLTRPSVVCILDAGVPSFTPMNRALVSIRDNIIKKQSFYEYKY